MNAKQKKIAIVAGGAVVLYLLYRWYSGRSSSASTATPDNTAGADYAQLAGQEQADTAALGNAEQTDVGNLSSELGALEGTVGANQGQEQSDISGLAGLINGLEGQISAMGTNAGGDSTASTATGDKKTSRKGKPHTDKKRKATPKPNTKHHSKKTKTAHPKSTTAHQSPHKHAGTGAVAPSTHEKKPRPGHTVTRPATKRTTHVHTHTTTRRRRR